MGLRKWIDIIEGQHSGFSADEEAEEFDLSLLGPTGKFRVFHASENRLKGVRPFIHLGTDQAALDRANDLYSRTGFYMHEFELTVTKSIEILDGGYANHELEAIMTYLETILHLDMNEVEAAFRDPVASANLLAQFGYDALHYTNRREDAGSLSWVALDPRKVKLIAVEHL